MTIPSNEQAEVSRRQSLTAEAIALLDIAAEPPLEGIDDVRPAVALAARDGMLAAEALSKIAATISGGMRARAAVESEGELAPLLGEIAAAIQSAVPAVEELTRDIETHYKLELTR